MCDQSKKKYVTKEVLTNYDLLQENQEIVKVLRGCGNNIHEVVTHDGKKFLVSMPSRFRKHVWIKRGDFLVVESIPEGVKVKGEIVRVLLKDQIEYLKSEGIWPSAFDTTDRWQGCYVINKVIVEDSDSSDEVSSDDHHDYSNESSDGYSDGKNEDNR